jgi:hypothetical protein
MMMHKNKRTNKSKRGFFQAVTIDTTNKGSRPEIHARVGGRVGSTIESSCNMLTLSTPPTRGSFSTPPTKDFAHVDDDELPKNGPIRMKARDRPPTRRDLNLK